ncbi:MAG: ChrR family anti-sigma-E factor [Pseudomonadota bacterium]
MSDRSAHRHPRSETLALYAAGGLDEARAVVVATHLTICDECRLEVRDWEALGGIALETVEPAPMSDNALTDFWARAEGAEPATLPASLRAANDFPLEAAQPLRRYLKNGLDGVPWKTVAPGLAQHILQAEGYRPGVLRLLKIAPGVKIPVHGHKDNEVTLILRGAYHDHLGVFQEGDFADLDEDDQHAPVAIGDEDCICLIATSAPLAFKSVVGKIVQPFIGL